MGFSIPDCFMIAFAAGLLFGLVYEALRIIRLILRFKAATFVCDIVFFALSAWAVCTISKSLGNYIRVYTILGFGAGVFAYIVTLGRLLNLAESAASVAWRKTIGRFVRFIGRNLKKMFGEIVQISRDKLSKTTKYITDKRKNAPKHLHSGRKMMYNKNISENNGENRHVIKAKITKSP